MQRLTRFTSLDGWINSINAAALLLGAAGLFSRILGVLRDRLLASHFGASRELDMYYAAFQIPDFVFNLFLIGAASTAIIPIFLEVREKSHEEAQALISNLLKLFIAGTLIITVFVVVFMPALIDVVTPGFSAEHRVITVTLARLMMASPFFLGLSGIFSAVVQSFRKFVMFALSPIFYNIGIICGIVFLLPRFGLPGLAFGVILGAFLHLLIQMIAFFNLGFRIFPHRYSKEKIFSDSLIKIMKLSFPRIIAASISDITTIVLVAASSILAAGSITIFQFANNLSGLPVGIFGVSLAVAAFPALSEHFMRKEAKAFFDTQYAGMRYVLFWTLPLGVFFYVLRAQIVRVALGAGKFNWHDTRLTAASLGIMVFALVAYSLTPILIRTFYALGNTLLPLLINLASGALTVVLAFIFMAGIKHNIFFANALTKILRVEDLRDTAILGIALATSVGALFDVTLLTIGSLREARKKFGGFITSSFTDTGKEIFKMFVVAVAAGFVAFEALRIVNIFVTLDTFMGVLIQGAVSFIIGSSVYICLLYIMHNREVQSFIEVLKRRMIRLRILPKALDGEEIQ